MVNLVFAGDSIASAYEARIIAASGTLSFTHLAAVRAFIATGQTEGWWDKIIDCCPFLGSNLNAALVKLVVADGTPTSYVAHNGMTDANYSTSIGVFLDTNTEPYKYISTGVIPEDHGLSLTNCSVGMGSITDELSGGRGFNGGVFGSTLFGNFGAAGLAFGYNRQYMTAASLGDGVATGATDGIGTIDAAASSAGDMGTEFEIFRGFAGEDIIPCTRGTVGFFFVGEHLTAPEIRAVTAAARQMHVSARQIVVGTHDVFIGDSITVGQGAANGGWAEITMTARAASLSEPHYVATNVAQAGIGTIGATFVTRYTGTGAFPVTIYFTKMGQNDISIYTDPSTGIVNPSAVAAYKQALIDMATTLKALNTLTVLVSISYAKRADPWLTMENDMLSQFAFADACLEAAAETGTLGVDTCRPMWDDPDPGRFLIDNLHLNSTGAEFVRDLVMAAYATYRGW